MAQCSKCKKWSYGSTYKCACHSPKVDDFDPNLSDEGHPPYATYIPTRTTKAKFSTHRTIAHAKNAIKGSAGAMYKWENGRWEEIYKLNEEDQKVQLCCYCGKPQPKWGTPEAKEHPHYLTNRWAEGDVLHVEYYNRECEKNHEGT